jgi:hypothetical protein
VPLVCPACIGGKGGKVTSPAKIAAARLNATRPRPGRSVRFDKARGRWLAVFYVDRKRHTRRFRSQRDAYSFVATVRAQLRDKQRED